MRLLLNDHAMYGLRFIGKRYDIGNKLDFLKTNIEFAMMNDELRPGLTSFIREMAKALPPEKD